METVHTNTSKKKTPKAQKTRAKLLDAAKDIFAQKGFHKTTANDIANIAGVGYGTFYLYFKDKKDIFYTLITQVEDDLYTASQDGVDLDQEYEPGRSSYRALRKDIKAIFKSFLDHAEVVLISKELAVTDPEFKVKYEALRARLIKRTEQILEKSNIAKVNYRIAAIAIAGMIESVANECIVNKVKSNIEEINIEEIIPTITKLYFRAVA